MTDFSPREIVSELDRFIVGQADAKRAVAIALRNRWRRLQLDEHHGFKPAQVTVGTPVLSEFDRGAGELTGILLKFALQPFEKREGVGGGASEAADDVTLTKPAHLLGVGLDDGLADRHLAVATDDDATALADGEDGGAVPDVRRGIHSLKGSRAAGQTCKELQSALQMGLFD